jgi:hypothetical protein
LPKLRHPGWLRAWARNYEKDGFWLINRFPIDPEALKEYSDWKLEARKEHIDCYPWHFS